MAQVRPRARTQTEANDPTRAPGTLTELAPFLKTLEETGVIARVCAAVAISRFAGLDRWKNGQAFPAGLKPLWQPMRCFSKRKRCVGQGMTFAASSSTQKLESLTLSLTRARCVGRAPQGRHVPVLATRQK